MVAPASTFTKPSNPTITAHALKRTHERFGIPISKCLRWLKNKFKDSLYMGVRHGRHLWQNGGVGMLMDGCTIVTVIEATREEHANSGS